MEEVQMEVAQALQVLDVQSTNVHAVLRSYTTLRAAPVSQRSAGAAPIARRHDGNLRAPISGGLALEWHDLDDPRIRDTA
jgi:hypothetical protein